ncbi:MAG: hypothetical protein Q7T73_09900 [Beijerinckiaceae bacterium]|nr:hypothetical protein [Beijerinckiaceae bacterium]
MKLKDAVKVAEDAGLDAQVTVEEGGLVLLATIPGPRRDANDYVVRAIAGILDDGTVTNVATFAECCRTFKKKAA